MLLSYNKLWKLLIDRKIRKTELQKAAYVSANVIARLGKDEFVSLESIGKICLALNCGVDDILEFIPASAGNCVERQ
ncbi:MAG: helix-turn-helix transcriptional regulator [Clostridiaceae bacterium]|jgi:DNA-binding Xre family transcriptional regulator|nr:helix-turn-helix transcriptional regulator [Clostridiaceae bacterium]